MARVRSLVGWSRDLHDVVEGLPRGTYTAARTLSRDLLREAKATAPKHTGALRRSLSTVARRTGKGGAEVALTSDDPAAGIQETGGPIRMRRRKMTVPIGVERMYWDAPGTRREPREIHGLFKLRAKNGKEYLVTRVGRQIILRFALRESVYMPPQMWASLIVLRIANTTPHHVEAVVSQRLFATSRSRQQ